MEMALKTGVVSTTDMVAEGKIAAAVVLSIVGAGLLAWFAYKCFIEEDDEEEKAGKESDHARV